MTANDLERAVLALRDHEEYLRLVVEAETDVIYHMDHDRTIRWVSHSVVSQLGWEPAQMIGRTRLDFVNPDDIPVVDAAVRLLREQGTGGCNCRIRHANGTYRWCALAGRLLDQDRDGLDGYLLIVRDIDDAARAWTERDASERRFALMSDNSRDAICLGHDGVIEWVSAGVLDVLGRSPDEVMGTRFADLLHPDDLERVATMRDVMLAGGSDSARLRVQHADGTWHWVEIRVSPVLDADGRPTGRSVSNWRRVDEQVAMFEALAVSEAANRALAERLERFIAVMAHELGSPVTALRGAIDLIARDARPDSEIARYAAVAERQLHHLSHLLEDLLDIARARTGSLSMRVEPLDLRDVVAVAVETVAAGARDRHQRIVVRHPDAPVVVLGDQERLIQAVANLARNAVAYAGESGELTIAVEIRGAEACVVVCDDGIGLTPEDLDSVFLPLSRADAAKQVRPEGLGIGLSLVRTVAEMHGGRVDAVSEGLGRGTCFVLALPTDPALVAEIRDGGTPDAAAGGDEPTHRRVLVVDDHEDLAEIVAELLRIIGHRAETATSATDALALLGSADTLPDVVVLDIGLPDMPGTDLARAIRALPGGDDTVIVAHTGWGQLPGSDHDGANEIDLYVAKPVTIEQLEALPLRRPGR